MASDLLAALRDRVVVADGGMGTMLQAASLTLDDFEGHEGCNEILNVTRPDVVRGIHEAYFAVGCDAVETNTFGANLANLAEYGIEHRIAELAETGARLAREAADSRSEDCASGPVPPDEPRRPREEPGRPRWVLGSVGPGTKLPTLGHTAYSTLRDAYREQVSGLLSGGVDAVLVETCQDLLQAKAAAVGARRAMTAAGRNVPLIVQVTVETTGTMLLGSEIGAALTALEPLGIDLIGLNCATGPAEMSEHLRYLSRNARVDISVMPNAGLPVLGPNGATYPLTPEELAAALSRFVTEYGVRLVGGCCGTTPEHMGRVVAAVRELTPASRDPRPEPAMSSLYTSVPFRQQASVLMIGERTNANGSKVFREALLAGSWEDATNIARDAAREGAHASDVCVDYVGRNGVPDMSEVAGRLATVSTLPVVLDSTEPPVIEAGLERLGGRCVVNSVNFEDGDGPESRFARVMPIVVEHGAAVVALCIDEQGQARTAEHKVAIAERLIDTLVNRWGLAEDSILVDCLTFTLGTGQEESRRDGLATIEAIADLKRRHPDVQTVLGVSNISFGLSPAARVVLNSVFLHECTEAGLDAAIVSAGKILPISRIPEEQRRVALDLVYDRRGPGYDPLTTFLELFTHVTGSGVGSAADRVAQLAALPLDERLKRRIVDGERDGLTDDLDAALTAGRAPLDIVNDVLLDGMRTVGELFGSGQMQLPFVLQSAEVMKAAVAYLEPHMERTGAGKGTMVLATVKGDVHDIGKNLVDIILSNNGFTVVNLGIKQPIGEIIKAAEEHAADAIGMSGLLVKSTVVMKENLEEINLRGLADRWPVVLGGAALTRGYVEDDLASMFKGEVFYARDAFEGLNLMNRVMDARRAGAAVLTEEDLARQQERRQRRERAVKIAAARRAKAASASGSDASGSGASGSQAEATARSEVATDVPVPSPPFWGPRVVRGISLAEYVGWLDERALFLGQWGLKPGRGADGRTYEELVETEGRPRLRYWLDRLAAEQVLPAAVAYGYFPCVAEGDDLVVLTEPSVTAPERARFTFPRQSRDRRLCLADFFRPRQVAREEARPDLVPLTLVTMGERISAYANELFAAHQYRDYLEVHGLSVQLTEALAEYWHARVRGELTLPDGTTCADQDSADLAEIFRQAYRGSRYSFGYPACPDLAQQVPLVDLVRGAGIGVSLSEEFQLVPEQSTSALIAHHPAAKYFNA